MAILIKSDLVDANSSKMVTSLEKDKEDTESLIGVIQDFIDSSKEVLVGDSFEAVRNHLQEYINLFQTRIKIADSLINAIKTANQTMIDYMGDEDKIDSSNIDLLKQQLSLIKVSNSDAVEKINKYDSNKNNDRLEDLINRRDTTEAEINRLNNLIDITTNLEQKDASVYSTFLQSEAELTSFNNNIGGVKTISI